MVNREELRKLMYVKNKSVISVSEYLNISKQCFYNKINSKVEFTESEIDKLIKLFGETIWTKSVTNK